MYNNSLGQDLENVKCLKVNKMYNVKCKFLQQCLITTALIDTEY